MALEKPGPSPSRKQKVNMETYSVPFLSFKWQFYSNFCFPVSSGSFLKNISFRIGLLGYFFQNWVRIWVINCEKVCPVEATFTITGSQNLYLQDIKYDIILTYFVQRVFSPQWNSCRMTALLWKAWPKDSPSRGALTAPHQVQTLLNIHLDFLLA